MISCEHYNIHGLTRFGSPKSESSRTSAPVATVIKMLETLPDAAQNQVLDHLREYIMELQDDAEWTRQLEGTRGKLVAAAKRAEQDIAAGLAEPMDYGKL